MDTTEPEAAFDIFHLYINFLFSKFIDATASWKYLFANPYLHIYPAKGNGKTQKEMENHLSFISLSVCFRHEEVGLCFSPLLCRYLSEKMVFIKVLKNQGLTEYNSCLSFTFPPLKKAIGIEISKSTWSLCNMSVI